MSLNRCELERGTKSRNAICNWWLLLVVAVVHIIKHTLVCGGAANFNMFIAISDFRV